MKITMDGEYAYRGNPTEKVRVLCADGVGDYPVVTMSDDGKIRTHTAEGRFRYGLVNPSKFDLVPPRRDLLAVLNKIANKAKG